MTYRKECLEKAVVDAVVVASFQFLLLRRKQKQHEDYLEVMKLDNSPTFPTGNEIRADLAIVACVAPLIRIL